MKVTIIKQDISGQEVWRYSCRILIREQNHLVIEAYFDRDDIEFHGLWLCKGDRFIETYFFDRWYNIFEIHDQQNDHTKGWYCNISSPIKEVDGLLVYRDYALDLIVFPDGKQVLLDEDEYNELDLSKKEIDTIQSALTDLQAYFKNLFTKAKE